MTSPTSQHEGENLLSTFTRCSEMEPAGEHYNCNVLNILPVTTFRTIDLEGQKNSGSLFSRFCVEVSVFFSGISCTGICASESHGPECTIGDMISLLFFLVFAIGGTIFWVLMIIECATKESSQGNNKLIWILIIIFTHWIGALVYYLVRRPQRIAELGA